MSVTDDLARRAGARRVGQEWRTNCPVHDDEHASLDFREGSKGRPVFVCRSAGCDSREVLAAFRERYPDLLGTTRQESEARYEIRDTTGRLVVTQERYRVDGQKRFSWWLPGRTKPGLGRGKVADLPLFGSELLKDASPLYPVLLCEGGKAAEAARRLGFVALGTMTGASITPADEVLGTLLGYPVALWPDNDAPGLRHMEVIAERLAALGHYEVMFIGWKDGPPAGDAADFEGTKAEVLAMLCDQPSHEATEPEKDTGEWEMDEPDPKSTTQATAAADTQFQTDPRGGFVKLYGSILDSSVWLEDSDTRLVWITLMAMADAHGHVEASVPGIAHRARVSLEACRKALDKFMAPDPDSKDQDFEGRRLRREPRGFTLLNHAKYREAKTQKQVRDAERQRKHRDRDRESL